MQMCYVTIYSNFSLERPYVHKAKGSGLGPPPSEKACIDKGQTETKPYLLQLYRFWKPDRESKEWNKDHAAPHSWTKLKKPAENKFIQSAFTRFSMQDSASLQNFRF